jgi:uncharacterized protein YndB with AHSA1/START domain
MADTEFIIEPGRQDIVIKHTFDAPPETVFKVMTDPELIPKWWGPRDLTTIVDKMDVRPGGQWRFVHREDNGSEYGFHGVYHDTVPGQRVVQTTEFEGAPGEVALETMTFEGAGGKTKVVARALYPSVESRDAVIQAGMESGARETYERIDELLNTL